MKVQHKTVVSFKDRTEWDYDYNHEVMVRAETQLEKYLNEKSIDSSKIISINYSVTHERYNTAGIAQYATHILLVYEGFR